MPTHGRGTRYYRLATGVIRLPPLRERQGDLTPLIDHARSAVCGRRLAASTRENVDRGAGRDD